MDLTEFGARFRLATERAHEFAKQYVVESLPQRRVFRVRLNQSYDETASAVFERHPEDSTEARARQLLRCDEATAVAAMWRDRKVPQWADISVVGEERDATVLQVVVCGRFTNDEALLYHQREGYPPFHVVGPSLPPRWERGTRFSIHHREECWGPEDLPRLIEHRDAIWSLELYTDEFDREELRPLGQLPSLEILEHRKCSLNESAFKALGRYSRLRAARLWLEDGSPFSIGGDDVCPSLGSLTIYGIHRWRSTSSTFQQVAPGLVTIVIDGPIQDISGATALPARLDSAHFSLPAVSEESLLGYLRGVRELKSLSLRDTPVGDDFVEAIVAWWQLEYVDLVRTKISQAKIDELAQRYPALKMHPRPTGWNPKR
jgi:hypothetical protein